MTFLELDWEYDSSFSSRYILSNKSVLLAGSYTRKDLNVNSAAKQTAAPDEDVKSSSVAGEPEVTAALCDDGNEDAKPPAETPSGSAGALDESAHRLAMALDSRERGKNQLGAAAKTKPLKRPAARSQGVLRRPAAASTVAQCKRKAAESKPSGKKVTKVMKKKVPKMTRECVYSRAYHQAKCALAQGLSLKGFRFYMYTSDLYMLKRISMWQLR